MQLFNKNSGVRRRRGLGGGIGEFQTGNTEEKAGTAQGPGREIRVQASEGVERSGELQKSSEKAEFFLYNRRKL